MDEENLTVGLIEQLIKYLPEPEQMNQLAALKDQYSTLSDPEQFALVVRVTVPECVWRLAYVCLHICI